MGFRIPELDCASRRFPFRLCALGVALLLLGCGGAETFALEGEGLRIALRCEPSAPKVGDNSLWIEVMDDDGKPVADARPALSVTMPAMGAMPAMGGPAALAEVGPGRFRADYELSMGGSWQVVLQIARPDRPSQRAEGSLRVGSERLNLAFVAPAEDAHTAHAEGASTASSLSDAVHDHASAGEGGTAGAAPASGASAIQLDAARLRQIGVATVRAERRPFALEVNAYGSVVAEETGLADVALRARAWVRDLRVAAVGVAVEKGQVLFSIHSPELQAAQREFLAAQAGSETLAQAARRRLELWGLAPEDVAALARDGRPLEFFPVRAPASGFVVEKNLVEGSAFEAGERLLRIASLERVWIEAEVYESDLPLVQTGQTARIELRGAESDALEARVETLVPAIDPQTRTARLRAMVPNPGLVLRPGMFATLRLRVERGERLLVPQSALLHAGERDLVFLALGDGRFRPQAVRLGRSDADFVEVEAGLAAGDEVVRSGTFLIAAESRLREALERW